ncbi:MAG: TIGR04282 family arsenosugar biosynthesis glycosyltransferase [Vicinamibacterales bacterium]
MSRTLIVLARAPSAAGKSRLTAGLTPDAAREVREALFLDTLDAARGSGEPVTVCFTPDDARDEMAALAGRLGPAGGDPGRTTFRPRFGPQRGGDLGERMHAALADAVASGAASAILIGSDLPTLPPSRVAEAFAALDGGADIVLGPTGDGGYYLVGLREPRPGVFADVPWGTSEVLDRTLARSRTHRLRVSLVEPWHDVDDVEGARRALAPVVDGVGRRTREALIRAGIIG